MAQLMVL